MIIRQKEEERLLQLSEKDREKEELIRQRDKDQQEKYASEL